MTSSIERFYFDANIVEPLTFNLANLRTEEEYDADSNPSVTAISYINSVAQVFEGNLYLLVADTNVSQPSKLRSRKGALWNEPSLRKHSVFDGEHAVRGSQTRLFSLVNLRKFDLPDSHKTILNWYNTFLILTTLQHQLFEHHIPSWLAFDNNSPLPFNYNNVAKSIVELDSFAVLRYFPADNERKETLVTVGRSEFLDKYKFLDVFDPPILKR